MTSTSAAIRCAAGIGLVLLATTSWSIPAGAPAMSQLAQYCAPLEQTSEAHRIYCRQPG
jgi:hypothetical protein